MNKYRRWIIGAEIALFTAGIILIIVQREVSTLAWVLIIAGGFLTYPLFSRDLGTLDRKLTPEEQERLDPEKIKAYREENPEASLADAIRETTRA